MIPAVFFAGLLLGAALCAVCLRGPRSGRRSDEADGTAQLSLWESAGLTPQWRNVLNYDGTERGQTEFEQED